MVLSAALAAASCSPAQSPPTTAEARQDEAAYLPPPSVALVESGSDAIALQGLAAPGARVQLNRPGGGALGASADAAGRWRITAPATGDAQVFGLSQTLDGRTVQAEGYVFLSPEKGAWLLRAGAAARPLSSGQPRGLVIDYDRSGGTVISGLGPADGVVVVQVNGRVPTPPAASKSASTVRWRRERAVSGSSATASTARRSCAFRRPPRLRRDPCAPSRTVRA